MIIKKYNHETCFFRAERLNNLSDLQNWNKNSFASRKSYKIKNYGRLNKPHEEMMYFCNTPEQTLKEINYDYKTPVVVSAYKAKHNFSCVDIIASSRENNNDKIT